MKNNNSNIVEQNEDTFEMTSPMNKKVYYLTRDNYEKSIKLIKEAGDKLSENDFYKFLDLLLKILSYDNAPY